ncbi:MAG: tyrosine--tRNA ligase [Clostridia bacterium]|nr:tyrosine--tRNA ligase [Clostridia bacterium]
MLTPEEQMKIIGKGVETLISSEELLEKLKRSCELERPLVIKLGLDPSAPDIHLGHAVVLRKIRQLQDLGHHVVIVIGDVTGKIGDPTGRSKGRVALNEEQIRENAKTYCDQIEKVIDKTKTEVRFNSEWLSKLNFEEVIQLAMTTTVARILERDDFRNRFMNQIPIGIHELFYPLMQAYDSVELKADIELGGTDQTFNILMGRTLQKTLGQEQQVAIFMPILEGLDGVEKMSKSLNNYIGVSEPANVMFKKVMEVPDHLIIRYFTLATDMHPDDIDTIKSELDNGINPMIVKLKLANAIVSLYHTEEETADAAVYYEQAFSRKAIPEDIPVMELESDKWSVMQLIPLLIEKQYVKSRSDFLRLLDQGGIQINSVKLNRESAENIVITGDVLKIGKKRFIRLI